MWMWLVWLVFTFSQCDVNPAECTDNGHHSGIVMALKSTRGVKVKVSSAVLGGVTLKTYSTADDKIQALTCPL